MSIAFSLMLLANNHREQKLAFEEIESILTDPSKPVSINDLNNMSYLERCIKESLRLYPSVPFIGRIAAEDIKTSKF